MGAVIGATSIETPSGFSFHVIVSSGGSIYDPSYGVTFPTLGEYEEASLAGFFIVESSVDENEEEVFYLKVRKNNPNELEISE